MPQSIDELLKSIADLDPSLKATFAQMDQQAAAPGSVERQIAGIDDANGHPRDYTGFSDVLSNAKRFGKTVGSDLGNAALGLGKMLITPPAQLAMEQGGQLAADYAERGAAGAGVSAAEGLSGLPLRQIGSDFSQGNYPELAGHVAAGGLAALLMHKVGGAAIPEDLSGPRPVVEPRYSRPTLPRDAFNAEPIEAPASTPEPAQSPLSRLLRGQQGDLFDHTSANPEPAPSARYAFHQDDFEGGSFPMYHIEGGVNHGSTVSAGTLAEQGIPVPETPDVVAAAAVPDSPLARLLKPRIPADVAARAMDRGEPILDSPSTRMDMRALERGGGSTGADDTLAGREAHTGARMLDQGYRRALGRGEDPLWDFLPDRLSSDSLASPITPSETPTPGMPAAAAPGDVSVSSNPMDQLRALAARITAPRENHFTLPEKVVPDDAFAQAADVIRKRNPEYRADEQLVERRAVPRPGGGDVASIAAPDLGPEYAPASTSNPLMDFLKGEEGSVDPSQFVPTPEFQRKAGALAQAHQAGSLLMSPLTVGRIGVSNFFSALQKAFEQGGASGAGRILHETVGSPRQMARDAVDAFNAPEEIHTKTDVPRPQGIFGLGARAVGAVDRPFRNAMERAGFSPEDALTVTQQRTPITEYGRKAVAFQQGHALNRLLLPFVKAGTNALETGIVEPAQSLGNILKGEGGRADAVKVGSAGAIGALGYEGNEKLKEMGAPNWLRRLLFAAGGLYEVPASLGAAANDLAQSGDVKKAGESLARTIPVIGSGLDFSIPGLMHRVVPRALNPDYYTGTKRETTDPFTGKASIRKQIQAEIPGLAQLLATKPKTF